MKSKIQIENLEKEIKRKASIIYQLLLDQLLPDLQKISTQYNCHPQTEVQEELQEIASVEYNINPPKHSQTNKANAESSNKETRGTIPKKKGHIDHQTKFLSSIIKSTYTLKSQFQKKNVISTTSQIEVDTTASSP